MGMYTQVRGWLNVDSIGKCNGSCYNEICEILKTAKTDFSAKYSSNLRWWVCEDTIAFKGSNNCVYLFFGSELKNYNSDAETWISFLLNYFPNAEGRIDFQKETDEINSKYWLIAKGKIIKEDFNNIWCEGYGNMYHLNVK